MNNEAIRKDWVGQVVDSRFRLLEWLASAGQSGVFTCEVDGDAEHKAAIKLFPADAPGTEACAAGWATAVEISHPHLIGVYFTGRGQIDETNVLYVVTELASEVLSQILPERHLSPEETKEMLEPVLDALGFLHESGLVHGRVKPSNIMVVGEQLKLSEENFRGAAGAAPPPAELDIYDAPERAQGQLLPASDMWSLGITLVETLTQIPPVWNRTAGTEPIVPPSLPKPFLQIAAECMRVDPTLRCTLEEVKACLENGAAMPHRVAEPVKKAETADAGADVFAQAESRPQPRRKSRRGMVIGASAAVLIAVFAIVMLSSHHHEAPVAEQQTASAPTDSTPQQSAGETAQPVPAAPVPVPSTPAQGTTAATPRPERHAALKSMQGTAKGSVAEQVMPDVSPKASITITGTVKVGIDVDVDASGTVTDASIASQGPSKYFANLALKAAKGWKFVPAQMSGQGVPSVWRLEFRFRKSGPEVTPTEQKP